MNTMLFHPYRLFFFLSRGASYVVYSYRLLAATDEDMALILCRNINTLLTSDVSLVIQDVYSFGGFFSFTEQARAQMARMFLYFFVFFFYFTFIRIPRNSYFDAIQYVIYR